MYYYYVCSRYCMFDKLPIMHTTNVLLTFDIWSIDNYPIPFKNSLGTLSIFKLAMFQSNFSGTRMVTLRYYKL